MEKTKNTWPFRTDGNHWTRHFVGGKDTKRFNGSGKGNEQRMKMVLWFICCICYTFDLHNNYFDSN